MRRLSLLLPLALLVCSGLAWAADPEIPSGPASTYDYAARRLLAVEAHKRNDTRTELYHAAWLAYLAPKQYSEIGEAMLRGPDLRDSAHHLTLTGVPAMIVAAQDARRALMDTCNNGAVPSQSARLQSTISDFLKDAEEAKADLPETDPVARVCLADLYLTLDDALRLAGRPARDRKQTLRRVVTEADAATRLLPNAPGGYRLSAIGWARQAELSNDPGEWDLAITACAHALSPDPDNQVLWELMWTLHLRAGHWDEARRWQRQCEQGRRR